jgi:hypothetical protein
MWNSYGFDRVLDRWISFKFMAEDPLTAVERQKIAQLSIETKLGSHGR